MTSEPLNKQLQDSLHQSEESFRLLVESVQDYAIFMLNSDGYIVSWNIGAERIKGYQSEEIIGQHFSCFYPLEDIERGKPEQGLKVAQNCGRVEDEGWRLRKDGSRFWANVVITALRDNNGNLQGFAKVTRDMTERKMAEELRTSHFLVNSVLEGITDAVFVKDIQSQYLLINSAGANFIGKPVAEIIGKDDTKLFATDSALKIIADDRQILRTGASLTYEETVTVDNITRTYLTTKTPYRDEGGNTLGLLGISRDISERKIFESQLNRRSHQQEAIAHLGQLALSGIDLSTLFDETVARIAEVLGNEYCKILELLPDGNAFLLRAGVGWQAGLVGSAKVGTELKSQAGYTLLSNYPVIVDDLRTETRFNGPQLLHNHGVISGMSVIIAGQNRPWGVLGTHTTQHRIFTQDDVNFFQAAANILAQALARKQMEAGLQQASRMKDEFLAIVSHELRSPLNAILGWATILQRNSINDATKAKAVETIERNARLQTQLIEDLLDVSRIITGKLKLNMQSLQIAAIVQAAIESVRPAADAKQIHLLSLLDPTVGTVKGDLGRLQQVIWNLLSNAIKFTPSGGRIQVQLDKVNSNVEITVSDTGIGIEPEFLPFVFERFRQADATTTRAYGGLGLGLAIVRHLVELHGGTICVESSGKEQGATFTLKLPSEMPVLLSTRVPDGGVSLNSSDPFACLPTLTGIKVLIVDDEADTRDYQATVLSANGAIVKAVASAAEALEVVRQWQPDVLLSDIGMPLEDGYSLIRKIRALPLSEGRQIPAAALTAYTKDDERQQALTSGFQQHLSKPVEPTELVKVVASLATRN